MRLRLAATCLLLSALLAALPAAAVPAPGGPEGSQGAAFQARGCFGDPTDDVVDMATGRHAPGPAADIREWCVDHTEDQLTVALRAVAGTDPADDPTWADRGAAVAFPLRGADGTPVVLDLSVDHQGSFGYRAYTDVRVPEVLCEGPAARIDDVWTAAVPAGCFEAVDGLPDTVAISAQLLYGMGPGGSTDQGLVDAAPDGGSVSIPRQVTPAAGLDRFAGSERVATSIEISRASFADGAADAVVLARSDVFADAVVAAPLAVALDAPLLLTGQDAVSDAVLLEIQRAMGGPGRVVLLGGTSAIRSAVEVQLADRGHQVERVEGPDRFATSTAVARATTDQPGVIFVADGEDFPDALVAGAIAPAFDGVVVLTSRGRLPDAVAAYLDAHPEASRYTVGRHAAAVLPEAPGAAGATPFQTSAALAAVLDEPAEVVVANGERFPDGLAGGAYAARRGAPLLLTPRDALDTAVLSYLEEEGGFARIAVMGGVDAVSETVAGQVGAHLD